MTVDEFLTELYNDELSDLFIGNQNDKEESRIKLLPLMNTGMTYAYSTYKVVLTTTQLQVLANVKDYTLPQTDVLAILRVINSYGRVLEGHEVQILGKTLHFPEPKDTELQVEYKVKPMRFTEEMLDDEEDVVLPDMLIAWLRAYVAHRYLASRKTEADIVKAADFKLKAAEAEEAFQATNTTNEYSSQNNTRLCGRGFA